MTARMNVLRYNDDEEDDRIYQPCSCETCGHVSTWASVIASEGWRQMQGLVPIPTGPHPPICENCGSNALRPGIIHEAPVTRQ